MGHFLRSSLVLLQLQLDLALAFGFGGVATSVGAFRTSVCILAARFCDPVTGIGELRPWSVLLEYLAGNDEHIYIRYATDMRRPLYLHVRRSKWYVQIRQP